MHHYFCIIHTILFSVCPQMGADMKCPCGWGAIILQRRLEVGTQKAVVTIEWDLRVANIEKNGLPRELKYTLTQRLPDIMSHIRIVHEGK